MGRRRSRRAIGVGWVATWWLLPGFALMVFMTAEEMHRPRDEPVQIQGGANWDERLHSRIDAVTAALRDSSLDLSDPIETTTGSGTARYIHRSYTVTFHPERQIETELAIEALRDVDPGLTLTRSPTEPDGFEVKIGIDGLLTHTIRFRPLQPASAPPRIALVARSLGDDLLLAREIVQIDAPIALGIRPSRPFSREVAELARLFGREVLLDVSLVTDPRPGADDAGIFPLDGRLRSSLDNALQSVPYAVGVTAEVESGVTANLERLDGFLAELNRRGLFWITNLPKPERLGALKAAAGLRVGMRSVLITGQKRESLDSGLEQARQRARADGVTVTLATATPDALEVLAETVARWRSTGVDLVPVSSLPESLVGPTAP